MDSKETNSLPSSAVDDMDMETVELHRAESLLEQSPPEIIEKAPKDTSGSSREKDVFSLVITWTIFLFHEIKDLKLEVVMFLYMFSATMRQISSTTMIMDKVCLVHMGLSPEVCANLSSNLTLKSQIEKITNNYSLGHGLISLMPSALLSSFIGPWSDRYGRKVPIIAGLLGIIIDGLGSAICASVLHSRAEYFFIPPIFAGLSGGMIGVLTVLYSYASDITTFKKRTMKFALMEVAFGLAMPLGSLTGGMLYKYTSYVAVFLISTAGHIFALAWVLFVLKETKGLDNNDSWKVKFRNFWSLKAVVGGFKAATARRPNKGREQILFLLLAMSMTVLSMAAAGSIGFLYAHHRYDWDNTKYSTVSSIFAVFAVLAMFISVPLFRYFKFGDSTLGLVGSVSLLVKNILIGLAEKHEFYYLANLLGLLVGLGTLAGRSRISKVVSKDDLGKVFAFLSSAESILPIAAVAVVSQIFNATLEVYPGLIFLVLGVLMAVPIIIFIWLGRLPNVNYEEMHNNAEIEKEAVVEKSSEKL